MHVVYHKTLKPKIVRPEEFFEYLNTREWFDRPQINLEGNSYEAERLLNEFAERSESRSRQIVRPPIYSDSIIQRQSNVDADKNEADRAAGWQDGCGGEHQIGFSLEKRKRGRPAKRQLDLIDDKQDT